MIQLCKTYPSRVQLTLLPVQLTLLIKKLTLLEDIIASVNEELQTVALIRKLCQFDHLGSGLGMIEIINPKLFEVAGNHPPRYSSTPPLIRKRAIRR